MRGELTLPLAPVLGFLLVLARMAGVFVFLPLPGVKDGPQAARVFLAISLSLALFPLWPQVDPQTAPGQLAVWVVSEAALGIATGLAVSFFTEALVLTMQVAGLQAGYAYASIVDPNTQADSGVLLVFAQLFAGLLFFALGLDREILRIFARSLVTQAPGTFTPTRPMAEQILRLGSNMFTTGLRLAMPVVALLLMIDISLALVGRINAQLQLLTLAFPVKMLVALFLLAGIATLLPGIYRSYGEAVLSTIRSAVAH
jgi:flagellar biosynthesis protein FliR